MEQGVVNPEKEEPKAKIQDDGTDKNKNTEDTEKPKDVDKTGMDMKEDSEKYVKNEDKKAEVADPNESDLNVLKDKMEKDLKNEREDKLNKNTVKNKRNQSAKPKITIYKIN